jgi:hypothetical protein
VLTVAARGAQITGAAKGPWENPTALSKIVAAIMPAAWRLAATANQTEQTDDR